MPIYEYKCSKCGKIFEHLVRNSSKTEPKCPECGAENPEKLLSSFSTTSNHGSDVSSCPTGTCPLG